MMELIELQALLKAAEALPIRIPAEKTLFSIGARGHYENPTSDVLAFFLDNNAFHGLGSLVLNAFIDCLPPSAERLHDRDASLTATPQREVVSPNGGRLDLILEAGDWVMAIENKIFHVQNNPFQDYELHLQQKYEAKRHIRVVLSPGGEAPEGWFGISYPGLIEKLKPQMGSAFMEQPLNKWLVLLREFILHLEQLMSPSNPVPEETAEFVLSHLGEIQRLQQLRQQVVDAVKSELTAHLNRALDKEIRINVETWGGFPAIRAAYQNWHNNTSVVLYLDGEQGHGFRLHCYVGGLEHNAQRGIALELNTPGSFDVGYESRESIARVKRPIAGKSKADMFKAVESALQEVDGIESRVRAVTGEA